MNKTKKIRIERTERVILPTGVKKFCVKCQKERIFFLAENAALYFGLTAREVYRIAETGTIDFYERADGRMYVCMESVRTYCEKLKSLDEKSLNTLETK